MTDTTEAPTSTDLSADLSATFAPEPGEQSGGGEGLNGTPATPEEKGGQTSKPSFTKDDVREILQGVIQSPKAAEPEKQYTQEELNTMFNVFQPTEDLVSQMGLPVEAIPAMTQLRDGLIKQANTYVEARLAQMEKMLDERFGPIAKDVESRKASESEAAFFKEHSDLEAHKETVQMVLAQLKQQGVAPKSAAEASKILAESTRSYLKKLGVELPAGDGGSVVTPPPVKMASLSGAGAGAAGHGAGSAGSRGVSADLKSVFG